jgi:hypothetical protein
MSPVGVKGLQIQVPRGAMSLSRRRAAAAFSSAAEPQQIALCRQRRNHPVGRDESSRPDGRALHVRETCIIMHTERVVFDETAL